MNPTDRHLLDVVEAAAYLNISERHLRRLANERRIPFVRIGGRLRFLLADLDAMILAGRVEAVPSL